MFPDSGEDPTGENNERALTGAGVSQLRFLDIFKT